MFLPVVGLRQVAAVEPPYFCYLDVILLAHVFGSFRPIVARFV